MIDVKHIVSLPGHQNPIFTVCGSQKPHIFFTAGNDRGIVEWSMKTMDVVKVLMPVRSSVYALYSPPELPLLISGERSGRVNIYHFGEQKLVHAISHHKLPVFDIKTVRSKNELLVASEDGTVSVWSSADFKFLYQFKVSAETVRNIAISNDEKHVAFGCKDSFIRIYNLSDYSFVAELAGHTMSITSLQFSPDGRYLLSGSRDAQLKIWNLTDFSLHQNIAAHLFAVYDIKYHPSLNIFATASRDKSIKIWDAADFRLLRIISREKGFPSHVLSVNKIAWNSFNDTLVSVGDDKQVMIWEVKSE